MRDQFAQERSFGRTAVFLAIVMLSLMGLCACATQPAGRTATDGAVESGTDVGPASLGQAAEDAFAVDPETLEFGTFMEEEVDNFVVIIDASASKHLPYKQQVKLKVAKDIARRFNQNTPDRPLFGGLRRLGWDAGAFSTDTELIYGMRSYDRKAYADAIEILRWAGGKSPLAKVIQKGGDDLALAPMDEYLAMVIVSDGKIGRNDPDPVLAARKLKERFGDRICIYTVAVGDDIPFEKPDTPEDQAKYRAKYKLMRDIAKEGRCGYMVTANDLIPDQNMEQFTYDVFHRTRSLAVECPDEDQDGVCDDVDRCPGTPKGAKVDEDGCWILGKVQFDLNKWNIKPEYRPMLDDIARVLNMNPGVQLAVQGHTCTIWTEEYNMKLSHWRAMSVASYLMNKGVAADQLAVEGYGFHRPFMSNDTEAGRSMNRRVEFSRIR